MDWRLRAQEIDDRGCIRMGIAAHTPEHVRYLALAMAGEAGELAEEVALQWAGEYPFDAAAVILFSQEMADVRVFAERFATAIHLDLEAACAARRQQHPHQEPSVGAEPLDKIRYLAMAIAAKAGAIANDTKKQWRGDCPFDDDQLRDRFERLVVDVRVNTDRFAQALGIDPDQACEDKITEVLARNTDSSRPEFSPA